MRPISTGKKKSYLVEVGSRRGRRGVSSLSDKTLGFLGRRRQLVGEWV